MNSSWIVKNSFKVRDELIVYSLEDAFNCFMGTEIDCLIIENCFLEKKMQESVKRNYEYKKNYELD